MRYRCTICNWAGELPEDAILVPGSQTMYRFAGGVHVLRSERTIQKQKYAAHVRFHVKKEINVSGCCYCDKKRSEPIMGLGVQDLRTAVEELSVEPTPTEPDPVQTFLDEEENPLGEIPEVEEVKQAPAEQTPEPFRDATVSYAFSKSRKENQ